MTSYRFPRTLQRTDMSRRHRLAGQVTLQVVGERLPGIVAMARRLLQTLQANRFEITRTDAANFDGGGGSCATTCLSESSGLLP